MSSSLSRSRSSRKPSADLSSRLNSDNRHASPTRLPPQPPPANRSASTATNRSTGSATTATSTQSHSTSTTNHSRGTSTVSKSATVITRSSTSSSSKTTSAAAVDANASRITRSMATALRKQPSVGLAQLNASKKDGVRASAAKPTTRSTAASDSKSKSTSKPTSTPSTRSTRSTSSSATTSQPPKRATGHVRAKSSVTPATLAATAPLRPTSATSLAPTRLLNPTRKPVVDTKHPTTRSTTPRPTHDSKTAIITGKTSPGRRTPPDTRKGSPEGKGSPVRHPATPPRQTTTTSARLRPTFNTLQQHYSPAKTLTPKPSTTNFLAPSSPLKPPANIAALAETSRLQLELLALHLIHRDAGLVNVQWQASAKEKLGRRFDELVEASAQVEARERATVERGNVLALMSLGPGLEGKIQSLDAVLDGLWSMSDAGGKYARMTRKFERWTDQVSEIQETRRAGGAFPGGIDGLFISELDASWKEDCLGIVHRLDDWRRQLKEVGDLVERTDEEAGEPTSLGRILDGLRYMIHGMMAEIDLMEDIEQEALGTEDRWVKMMIREDENRDGRDDTPKAGAIWRST